MSAYRNPAGESSARRTSTGKFASVEAPSYPEHVNSAILPDGAAADAQTAATTSTKATIGFLRIVTYPK